LGSRGLGWLMTEPAGEILLGYLEARAGIENHAIAGLQA
jgi:hypothetical protein